MLYHIHNDFVHIHYIFTYIHICCTILDKNRYEYVHIYISANAHASNDLTPQIVAAF